MRGLGAAVVAICGLCLAAAPAASAKDSIYWATGNDGTISRASLDGSGGENLYTATCCPRPSGVALDPAAGHIYWTNFSANTISRANLDGGGKIDLPIVGTVPGGPEGLAIDVAAGKLYWANSTGNTISASNLDGSGATDLNTTGATAPNAPIGVAVDPAAGKIYWANLFSNKISWANLDGSGGGDLNTAGSTPSGPAGIGLDLAGGKVYWSNFFGGISWANLNGSGGGDLVPAGPTVENPRGIAIDPAAGRIFWTNSDSPGSIGSAELDGTDDVILDTTGAIADDSYHPGLLKAPVGAGLPVITDGPGSKTNREGAETRRSPELSCSEGNWEADLGSAHLFRAAASYAYQWLLDGAEIDGATTPFHTANGSGFYECRVTASNEAGSTAQTSDPFEVLPDNEFQLGKLKTNRKNGTAKLTVTVPGPGSLVLSGKSLRENRKAVAAGGSTKLKIKPKGKAKKKLRRRGKVKVKAEIAYTPTGGETSTRSKKLKLKRKPRRR